jgi:hypothetical protein
MWIPWDPSTTVWYAHYDNTTGELLSLGTVQPDPLPAGTRLLELLQQPNLTQVDWSPTARIFIDRNDAGLVDRVAEIEAEPGMASVWTQLDAANDATLRTRLIDLLGPYRYRQPGESANLGD